MYKTHIHLRKDDTEMMRLVHRVYFANNVVWKIHDNGTCVLKDLPYMTFTLAERNRLFYDMFMYYFKKNYDEIDVMMQCSGARKDFGVASNSFVLIARGVLLLFLFFYFDIPRKFNTDNDKHMLEYIRKSVTETVKITKEILNENKEANTLNFDKKYCKDLASIKQNNNDFNTTGCRNFLLTLASELLKNKSKYQMLYNALNNQIGVATKGKLTLFDAMKEYPSIKNLKETKEEELQQKINNITNQIKELGNDVENEKKNILNNIEKDIKRVNSTAYNAVNGTQSLENDIENEKKKIENKFVNGTQRLENEMNIKKKVIENYVENEEKNIDNKFVNKSNELNNNLIFVQTTLTKNREELKALSAEQNEKDKEDDYGDVRILGEESKERTKAINQMQILGAKIKSDEEKETEIKEELLALEQSKDQKLEELEKEKEENFEELEKDKEEKLAKLEKEKKKEFAALKQRKQEKLAELEKEKEEKLAALKQRKQEKLAELEKEKKNLTEASKKLGTNQTITEALDASRELLSKVSDDQLEYAILKNSDLSSNSVRSQIVGNIATLGISKNDKMFKKWAISFILKKDNSSNDFNRFIIEKFMFAIDFTFFHIGLFFLNFLPLQKILDSFKGEISMGTLKGGILMGTTGYVKYILNDLKIEWDYRNIWLLSAIGMSVILYRGLRGFLATAFTDGMQRITQRLPKRLTQWFPRWAIVKYAKNEYYYDPNSLRIELVQNAIQAGNYDVRMIFLPGQSVIFRGVQHVIIAIHGDKDEKRIAVEEEHFANDVISSTNVTMFEIKECYQLMDAIWDRKIEYYAIEEGLGENLIKENRSVQNAIYSIPILFEYKNITYCLGESGKIKPYTDISNKGLKRKDDGSICFNILIGKGQKEEDFQEKTIQLTRSIDRNQDPSQWFNMI